MMLIAQAEEALGGLSITQLGVYGALAIFILDKVMYNLKGRGIDLGKMCKQVDELAVSAQTTRRIEKLVDEIWDIHLGQGAMDEDRRPRWYFPSSFQEAIKQLADNTALQTQMMQTQTEAMRNISDTMMKMHTDNHDIKRTLEDMKT